MGNVLYLVVPCYNEEKVLHATAKRLGEKMRELAGTGKISNAGKIVFIDDGSRDGTWGIIEQLCRSEDRMFAGVKLSRNRGHQNALYAGLMTVKDEADMVISIDADLQDDIDAVDKMVDDYINGSDVVYGVRGDRKTDTFFKRATAQGFYRMLSALGCDVVFNHADYRLMSSRVLQALSEYGEQGLYLRGIIPMLGYKSSVVQYVRGVREAGESKYPLRRMLTLAFDGITALSLRPLRIVTLAGAFMLAVAAALLVYAIAAFCMGKPSLRLKILMFSNWAVGGIITLSLGIVGEYVGRTYMETKRRPRYGVEKCIGIRNGEDELGVRS